MPLQPNFIERQVIKSGIIPGLLLDGALPTFMLSALIGAGEIDLFGQMRGSPATLKELAGRTNTKERALQNLLQVLEPLGYIEYKKGKYHLTKYAKKALPIDLMQDMMPFIKDQVQVTTANVSKALREAPESGVVGWDRVKSGEIARSYQVTMRWLAGSTVGEVTKKLDLPKGASKMLDVGGSHGLY